MIIHHTTACSGKESNVGGNRQAATMLAKLKPRTGPGERGNGVRANIAIRLSLSLKVHVWFLLFLLGPSTALGPSPACKNILNVFPKAIIAQYYFLIKTFAYCMQGRAIKLLAK